MTTVSGDGLSGQGSSARTLRRLLKAKTPSARSIRSTSPARRSAENFGRCRGDGCPCHSRAAHRATPRFFWQHAHGVRACCRPNRDAVRPPQRERQGHPFSRLSGRDRIEKEVPVKPTNLASFRAPHLSIAQSELRSMTALHVPCRGHVGGCRYPRERKVSG